MTTNTNCFYIKSKASTYDGPVTHWFCFFQKGKNYQVLAVLEGKLIQLTEQECPDITLGKPAAVLSKEELLNLFNETISANHPLFID